MDPKRGSKRKAVSPIPTKQGTMDKFLGRSSSSPGTSTPSSSARTKSKPDKKQTNTLQPDISFSQAEIPACNLHRMKSRIVEIIRNYEEENQIKSFVEKNINTRLTTKEVYHHRKTFSEETSSQLNSDPPSVQQIQFFVRKQEDKQDLHCIAAGIETDPVGGSNSHLWFFDFQSTIYILSSKKGWQLLQRFCDGKFPIHVANILFSEEGAIQTIESMPLGNLRGATKTKRKPSHLKESVLPVVVNTFTAHISEDGKSRLPKGLKIPTAITADFGYARLNLKCGLTIKQWIPMMQTMETLLNEKPSRQPFSGNLTSIDTNIASELEIQLCHKIMEYLDRPDESDQWIRNLDICHKWYSDYTVASNKWLICEDKEVNIFHAPTVLEVFFIVREILIEKGRIEQWKHLEGKKLRDRLSSIRISFYRTSSYVEKPLLDFLWGIVFLEGDGYFKIGKIWYTVDTDFLVDTEDRFRQILSTHMLEETHCLQLLWPRKPDATPADEGVYNNLYANTNSYFVGDKKYLNHIEAFDIMKVDKDNKMTYLYHVKQGFAQTTRDLTDQMRNSAKILMKRTNKSNKLEEDIEKLARKLQPSLTQRELMMYLGVTGEYNVTFVMAVLDDALQRQGCSALQEAQNPLHITEADLDQKTFAKVKDKLAFGHESKNDSKAFLELLEKNGFCENINQGLRIQSKLLFLERRDTFDCLLKEKVKLDNDRDALYQLLKTFITGIPSMIVRYAIIEMEEFFRQNFNEEAWKICFLKLEEPGLLECLPAYQKPLTNSQTLPDMPLFKLPGNISLKLADLQEVRRAECILKPPIMSAFLMNLGVTSHMYLGEVHEENNSNITEPPKGDYQIIASPIYSQNDKRWKLSLLFPKREKYFYYDPVSDETKMPSVLLGRLKDAAKTYFNCKKVQPTKSWPNGLTPFPNNYYKDAWKSGDAIIYCIWCYFSKVKNPNHPIPVPEFRDRVLGVILGGCDIPSKSDNCKKCNEGFRKRQKPKNCIRCFSRYHSGCFPKSKICSRIPSL